MTITTTYTKNLTDPTDPLGLWGWNPIADVVQATEDVGGAVVGAGEAVGGAAVTATEAVGGLVATFPFLLGGDEGVRPEPNWVVRGGSCTLEQFENQPTDSNGNLTELSVQYQPGRTLQELSQPISRYGQVGVTTAEPVEALGGKVIPDPLPGNPYHAVLSGISPEQAYELFHPTIPNPGR